MAKFIRCYDDFWLKDVRHILTLNSEIWADMNKEEFNLDNLGVCMDSHWLTLVFKLKGYQGFEKLSGNRVYTKLLDDAKSKGMRCICVGGSEKAATNMRKDGRVDVVLSGGIDAIWSEMDAVDFMNSFVFVALGYPKQDEVIRDALNRGAAKGIGLGGTFEMVYGSERMAPKFIESLGLEWLWRAGQNRGRYKRWPKVIKGLLTFKIVKFERIFEVRI